MTERKATEREQCLKRALAYVTKDRNATHGDPESNLKTIADLWTIYTGVDIAPTQVAVMMILVKVARLQTSPGAADNWDDIAGYAAIGWEVACEEAR